MYPFQKVSIDLLTGLPVTDRGNSVMLTVVDCFSRWVELIPLPCRSAKEVALALRDRVFFRHGICDVVSDNGAELVSQIMSELYGLLGVRASTCTTYHPQSQGKVERTHRVIADVLAKYISTGEPHWDMYAAACQFAMNNSVHSATKHTPYYLVHGRAARLPAEALIGRDDKVQLASYHTYVEQLLRNTRQAFEEVRSDVHKAQKANQVRANDGARLRALKVGDEVLLYDRQVKKGANNKLASRWKSGFKVIDKFGNVNYYVENIHSKKRQLVHIDRLKLRRSRDGNGSVPQPGAAALEIPPPESDEGGWHDAEPSPPPRPREGDGNGLAPCDAEPEVMNSPGVSLGPCGAARHAPSSGRDRAQRGPPPPGERDGARPARTGAEKEPTGERSGKDPLSQTQYGKRGRI